MNHLLALIFICFTSFSFCQTRLTVREIYDFQVGDEFHYDQYYQPTGYRNIILDRKLSNKGDSLTYLIHRDHYEYYSGKYTFTHDTQTVVFTNLDAFIDDVSLLKYKKDSCHPFNDSFFKSIKYDVPVYGYEHKERCVFEGKRIEEEFGLGIGFTKFAIHDAQGPYRWQEDLKYYKKGTVKKGLPTPFSLDLKKIGWPYQTINVFPNPVHNKLELSKVFGSDSRITVTDCLGKSSFTDFPYSTGLNVSDLPAGLYYFTLLNGENVYKGRFVKE